MKIAELFEDKLDKGVTDKIEKLVDDLAEDQEALNSLGLYVLSYEEPDNHGSCEFKGDSCTIELVSTGNGNSNYEEGDHGEQGEISGDDPTDVMLKVTIPVAELAKCETVEQLEAVIHKHNPKINVFSTMSDESDWDEHGYADDDDD